MKAPRYGTPDHTYRPGERERELTLAREFHAATLRALSSQPRAWDELEDSLRRQYLAMARVAMRTAVL